MSLAGHWRELQEGLPERWTEVGLRLQFGSDAIADRAAGLLGPAQPFRIEPRVLRFSSARDGSAAGPDAIMRLLARLDHERIRASIELVETHTAPEPVEVAPTSLAEAWDEALANVPPDWSDLYGEVELISSAYVDRAAVLCVPINPLRDGNRSAMRFRSARRFGYGASPGMVRRCLERCDGAGITGSVKVLRVLSDTHPVSTQGPVWVVSGRTI